ncbi:MFS transporter [Kocuria sp. p3-SID1428]|uniref:MFS transporter n=1 Tax=Kocuria sp. p3-SID1428 TaxID=2916182 RepID=UPI0021A8D079|nr:MFS transporter [Kocuria sp. p3-SID1428]MCT1601338.1 MFS transporter [Kocuria sp. p3-SID1428]
MTTDQDQVPAGGPCRAAGPQRRILLVLVLGQVLGGLGTGATLSLGALLISELAGSSAWSGMAATMSTLGAALFALPLAGLAQARGRRISLSGGAVTAALGAVVAVTAADLGSVLLVLAGILMLGAAQAVNLQSRFAATDLADPRSRGRDLSLVVWSTAIGAVTGPNLLGPGEVVGGALGMPPLTGVFAFTMTAQLLAAIVYLVGLRPDPLLAARAGGAGVAGEKAAEPATTAQEPVAEPVRPWRAILTVALSHGVMVALMSMTPVHLQDHGSTLSVIGLTISLHIAGMYAFSPVFGILADRRGARTTVLLGQALLVGAMALSMLGSESSAVAVASLILLGLGWSASTVAGSVQISRAGTPETRSRIQGSSDTVMNLMGALGGASAGLILSAVGFAGLAGLLLVPVAVVVAFQLMPPQTPSGRSSAA